MAATENQKIQAQGAGGLRAGLADAVRLYEGTIAFFERTSGAAEGFVTDLDDSGANNFAGIVKAEVNNSAGSAGDLAVEFYTEGGFVFSGTSTAVGNTFNQGHVGDKAYASDSNTITNDSSSTTLIGKFIEFISTTKMRVEIQSGSDTGG